MKSTRTGEVHVILDMLWSPRGSGNRSKVRAVGECYKRNAELAPHIISIKTGASRLTLHLRPSFELARVIQRICEAQQADVPGQLPLFGSVPA